MTQRWIRSMLVVSLACSGQHATAATWYISESLGNDAWSGLLAEPNGAGTDGPKRSLAAAQTLLAAAGPGDDVRLRRGDVWTGGSGLMIHRTQGTAAQPVRLHAYGTGAAPSLVITGASPALVVRGDADRASRHVEIADLQFQSTAPAGSRGDGVLVLEGFHPHRPSDIVLRAIDVRGFLSGINIQADRVTLEESIVFNNFALAGEADGGPGVYVLGSSATIRNNLIDHNAGDRSFFAWNLYVHGGSGHVIAGNTLSRSVGGLKLRANADTVVMHNRFREIWLTPINVGGDDAGGCFDLRIEGNEITRSVGGITIQDQSGGGTIGTHRLRVVNNVIGEDSPPVPSAPFGAGADGLIAVSPDPLDDVLIAHNTVWATAGKHALSVYGPARPGLRVTGNLWGQADAGVAHVRLGSAAVAGSIGLDHNLYAGVGAVASVGGSTHATLPAFRAAWPTLESAGLAGAANLVGPPADLRPTEDSHLVIDTGPVLAEVGDDIDGTPRPLDGDGDGTARSDIGAWEFGSDVIFADSFE